MKRLLFPTSLLLLCITVSLSSCKKKKRRNKAEWITTAYNQIISEGRIKSVGWWNEAWKDKKEVNMLINSSDEIEDAMRNALSHDYFTTESVLLEDGKVVPRSGYAYNSAFLGIDPNTESLSALETSVNEFESITGKRLTMITCSSIWTDEKGGIQLPAQAIENISALGKTPLMYMEPWSAYSHETTAPDPKYNMQKITDGTWDTELEAMALETKAAGHPIMMIFGHEVNGQWFPWNGQWNGGAETTGFGDPTKPDGPERYVAAYRHIIDIFNANDVNNVTWVAGFDFNSQPEEDWNKMANYYAGDDYIDWIGLSIYGPKNKKDDNQFSFSFIWDYIQDELNAVSTEKPLMILEMGVGEH